MDHSHNDGADVWLDSEVIDELKRYKAPSEHDLNCVLRRLFELDCPQDERDLIERASTAPREYRAAILEALVAEGGKAKMTTIYDRVEFILRGVLKPVDYESYDEHGIRWKTAIRTVANSKSSNSMRKHGVIEYDSYDEVFRITDRGRKELEYRKQNSVAN